MSETPAQGWLARLLHALATFFCFDLTDQPALTAPAAKPTPAITEPRAAALAALGEALLADDPHAVDAADARIDHLVRKHLPHIAALHQQAVRTARRGALAQELATYEDCLALVAQSINEAAAATHAQIQTALTIERRFLQMRHGDDTDTPIPAYVPPPIAKSSTVLSTGVASSRKATTPVDRPAPTVCGNYSGWSGGCSI